jgi:hypothetical protein
MYFNIRRMRLKHRAHSGILAIGPGESPIIGVKHKNMLQILAKRLGAQKHVCGEQCRSSDAPDQRKTGYQLSKSA